MGTVRSANSSASPEAILKATGRPWEHWLQVLDAFDVKANGHKAAARHLQDLHGVALWWSQTLTVRYEQERGLRLPGQRSSGSFTINVSRTVAASPERAFQAWASAEGWNGWFTQEAALDFQVGGAYSNADRDAGMFTRIIEPGGPPRSMGEVARIEFTWENAKHCPGSKVTVQFLDKGEGKTSVAIEHRNLPDAKGCEDMKTGWTWALASLKSWLETGKPLPYADWEASRA